MTDHQITPPPALFKQWEDDILNKRDNVDHVLDCAWKDGFRAGADMELEACMEWLREARNHGFGYDYGAVLAGKLRADRLPKPPSLKERALEALDRMDQLPTAKDRFIIRRALEQLDD